MSAIKEHSTVNPPPPPSLVLEASKTNEFNANIPHHWNWNIPRYVGYTFFLANRKHEYDNFVQRWTDVEDVGPTLYKYQLYKRFVFAGLAITKDVIHVTI